VRPVGLFREYWKNDQANRSCVRGDYYVTGDRGIMDAEGYIWFVGRVDDVILSAGYRIGPFEVESASSSTRRSPSRPSSRVRTTFAVRSSRPASSSSPDSPPRTRW
jgi:acyl-CoA synthetase (AMP-forming)/AMP-acid ligase II